VPRGVAATARDDATSRRRHDQQGILCGDFVEATFIERSLRDFPGSKRHIHSTGPARKSSIVVPDGRVGKGGPDAAI